MKKRIAAVLIGTMMAASMLTACGSKDSDSSAASTTAAAEATSEAAEEVTTEAAEEEATEEETTEAAEEETAAADGSDISFVDGYYATDANGNDFMIAFYENAPGDVAYVNDGTNEAFAEYTVENAQTDEGNDYLLITVGQTQLGYIADGTDGGAYIIDADGNIYGAQALTEDEADVIYQALQEADNADVEIETDSVSDVQYVDGYYAADGNGSDFMIAFFTSSEGDFAYVTDGEYEVLADYTVSDAETSDGTAYTRVDVGETSLGYFVADGDVYIVDTDGNLYAGAALSEEEASQLYDIIVAAAQ